MPFDVFASEDAPTSGPGLGGERDGGTAKSEMLEAFGGPIFNGPRRPCPLGEEEMDILDALASGLSPKEIAHAMGRNVAGVHKRIQRVCTKLDAPTPTRAVVIALEHDWIAEWAA